MNLNVAQELDPEGIEGRGQADGEGDRQGAEGGLQKARLDLDCDLPLHVDNSIGLKS